MRSTRRIPVEELFFLSFLFFHFSEDLTCFLCELFPVRKDLVSKRCGHTRFGHLQIRRQPADFHELFDIGI